MIGRIDRDNWEDLVKSVDREAVSILLDDVLPVTKEVFKKHIQTDIYDAYTPTENGWVGGKTYERRYVLPDNIIFVLENSDTLVVTSAATASKPIIRGYTFEDRETGAFLHMIENGNMGIWKKGFPRPVVKNTEKDFETNKKIEAAIKRGIKNRIERG